MIEELKFYILSLISGVPQFVYEGLLSVFVIGAVILFFSKWRKSGKDIALLLLIEYLFLLYSSTVFLREDWGVIRCELIPFWSYSRPDLIVENIMNVVVFIPIGFLLGLCFNKQKCWSILLMGAGISLSIEVLQLFLRRGYSELDDVMHNTLGCLIGYGLYFIIRIAYEKISKRRVAVL